MDGFFELFSFAGFGFAMGGMTMVFAVIFSTIAGPPRDENDKAKHVVVYLIRLFFIAVGFLSMTILRPLKVAYTTHNAFAPILGMIIFFTVMYVGTQIILPRFMKVTVYRK